MHATGPTVFHTDARFERVLNYYIGMSIEESTGFGTMRVFETVIKTGC
jgi:hypothetical protein